MFLPSIPRPGKEPGADVREGVSKMKVTPVDAVFPLVQVVKLK